MFYNALARKGKLANAAETEEDEQDMMETVVSLHNDMNEKSWKKVLQWEDVTSPQEKSARLLKFQGRPSDLSPKAMFKHYVLGHPLPFDRHDWTVVRHDGSTVRYVLDYYYDDSPTEQETGKSSLLVDVRPALDSVSCMWHRFATMPAARHIANSTPFEPLPLRPTSAMKSQVPESLQVWKNIQADVARSRGQQQQQQQQQVDGSNKEEPPELTVTLAKARELKTVFDDTTPSACEKVRRALDACDSEEDCARASMAFTVCMAQFACPLQHQALITALQKDDDSAVDPALERVSDCVALQSQLHAAAKQQYPEVFQK